MKFFSITLATILEMLAEKLYVANLYNIKFITGRYIHIASYVAIYTYVRIRTPKLTIMISSTYLQGLATPVHKYIHFVQDI